MTTVDSITEFLRCAAEWHSANDAVQRLENCNCNSGGGLCNECASALSWSRQSRDQYVDAAAAAIAPVPTVSLHPAELGSPAWSAASYGATAARKRAAVIAAAATLDKREAIDCAAAAIKAAAACLQIAEMFPESTAAASRARDAVINAAWALVGSRSLP